MSKGHSTGVPLPRGSRTTPRARVGVDDRLAQREDRVVHRHVEELSLARPPRRVNRGHDAERGERAGIDVADARRRLGTAAALSAR